MLLDLVLGNLFVDLPQVNFGENQSHVSLIQGTNLKIKNVFKIQ